MKTQSIICDRLSSRMDGIDAFRRPLGGRFTRSAILAVAGIAAVTFAASILLSAHSKHAIAADDLIRPIPVVFVDPPNTTEAAGANSLESLRKSVEKDPTNSKYRADLGEALSEEGKFDEAIREYREAIRLDDKNIEARLRLGSLLVKTYKYSDAKDVFRHAVKLDPKNPIARLKLALTLQCQRKFAEAIGEYRAHLKLNRGETEDDQTLELTAHLYLGLAMYQNGEIGSAFKEYQIFLSKFYVFAAEDFSSMFYCCGRYLIQHEKYDDALTMNREAVRLVPSFAEARLSLGFLLVKRRAYKEASEQLIESIRLRPEIEHSHNLLGLCLEFQGELERAVQEYREELKHETAYKETFLNITRVLDKLERNQDIIKVSEQWIKRSPGDSTAHYLLGRALFIAGQTEKASKELEESIVIDPKLDCAYYFLGRIASSKGRFAEALKFYEKADELGSKRADWDCPTKWFIADAKRMIAAESQLKEYAAERYRPGNAEDYVNMINVAEIKGFYRSNVRLFEEYLNRGAAAEIDPVGAIRRWIPIAAALAGCGYGVDAHRDDEVDLRRLRRKALEWMSADLADMTREFEKNPDTAVRIRQNLEFWFIDFRLSEIRSLGNDMITQELGPQTSIPITGAVSNEIAQTSFHPNEPKRAEPSFLKEHDQIHGSSIKSIINEQSPRVTKRANLLAPMFVESSAVIFKDINGNLIDIRPLESFHFKDDERAEWKRFWKEASVLMRKVGGRNSLEPSTRSVILQK
jgi:tetratricopeptide (TPR) repeat protein